MYRIPDTVSVRPNWFLERSVRINSGLVLIGPSPEIGLIWECLDRLNCLIQCIVRGHKKYGPYKSSKKILRRQSRRQMKSSANEGSLQPRTERIGVSLCALRTEDMGPGQCCPGVDLHCYGCNPNLIALGIPCEDQELVGFKLYSDLVQKIDSKIGH